MPVTGLETLTNNLIGLNEAVDTSNDEVHHSNLVCLVDELTHGLTVSGQVRILVANVLHCWALKNHVRLVAHHRGIAIRRRTCCRGGRTKPSPLRALSCTLGPARPMPHAEGLPCLLLLRCLQAQHILHVDTPLSLRAERQLMATPVALRPQPPHPVPSADQQRLALPGHL